MLFYNLNFNYVMVSVLENILEYVNKQRIPYTKIKNKLIS